MTATLFHPHAFTAASGRRCDLCGAGWQARVHCEIKHAPLSVRVELAADLDRLHVGQRVYIDGALYEVVETLKGDAHG